MTPFEKNVLFLGFGAVARCALPIFLQHVHVPLQNVTVMDFEDRAEAIRPWTEQGVRFVRTRITPENLGAELGKYLSAGDLLIDLAWNIDCCECWIGAADRGVLYINTSVELWDPYADAERKHPTEKTLYWRHMNIRRLIASWSEPGPTAVLEHGANPGLISHWTKQGLLDIGRAALGRPAGRPAPRPKRSASWSKTGAFNRLAMRLGVKVIHCSERDTQIADQPKAGRRVRQHLEHRGLSRRRNDHGRNGLGHARERIAPRWPANTRTGRGTKSASPAWASTPGSAPGSPHYNIQGMVVRHGEAFTISDFLTVWEDGRAVYRPTVHYAYCPCDAAIASLQELRGRNYELQPKLRIMHDEIVGGSDILGALLMGHAYNAWWIGSDLSIEESRRLVPAPERHHGAGGHLGGGGRAVDDRQPAARRLPARAIAARLHPEDRQSLLGTMPVAGRGLDPPVAGAWRLCGISALKHTIFTIPGNSRTSSSIDGT